MWVFFLSHCKSIQIRCYTKLTPYVEKKTVLNLKKSNKKLTLEFLYEIVFVRNGICMNDSLACVCKNSGTTSYKKSLFEVTPMFLYEMVSLVRSGLCSKWSLYEMTVNRTYIYHCIMHAEKYTD